MGRLTVGDCACILGDDWAREHHLDDISSSDRLQVAMEEAPEEWKEQVRSKLIDPDSPLEDDF
jgi:hypothetical protein